MCAAGNQIGPKLPPEAISLALAASLYPPALAAVIAMGRGSEVRLRVLLFAVVAYFTVFLVGVLILLLFKEAGASSRQVRTPSAGLYIAAGAALLFLAARLRRPRARSKPAKESGRSKTDRYLESRWGVLALAVILYIVPSPIFVGGVKSIVDTHASTTQQLAYLAQMLLIMLWLIELPIVMLIVLRERGVSVLESVNSWFSRHGRALAVVGSAGVGVYLLIVGVVEAVG
jgi:hypothetical protein